MLFKLYPSALFSKQSSSGLPDKTLVCPAHDYKGQTVSTIGEEKKWNPRFKKDRSSFIQFMNSLNLPNPKKMMEAVPANEKCGKNI